MVVVVQGVEPALAVCVVALFDGFLKGVFTEIQEVSAVLVVDRHLIPARPLCRLGWVYGVPTVVRSHLVKYVDSLVVPRRRDLPPLEARIRQADPEELPPARITPPDQRPLQLAPVVVAPPLDGQLTLPELMQTLPVLVQILAVPLHVLLVELLFLRPPSRVLLLRYGIQNHGHESLAARNLQLPLQPSDVLPVLSQLLLYLCFDYAIVHGHRLFLEERLYRPVQLALPGLAHQLHVGVRGSAASFEGGVLARQHEHHLLGFGKAHLPPLKGLRHPMNHLSVHDWGELRVCVQILYPVLVQRHVSYYTRIYSLIL